MAAVELPIINNAPRCSVELKTTWAAPDSTIVRFRHAVPAVLMSPSKTSDPLERLRMYDPGEPLSLIDVFDATELTSTIEGSAATEDCSSAATTAPSGSCAVADATLLYGEYSQALFWHDARTMYE